MRLIHKLIQRPIQFEENKINTLVVENSDFLYQLLLDFQKQIDGEEGNWVMSENNEEIVIKNHVEVIMDFININPNNSKVLKGIYCELEKLSVDELHYEKTLQVNSSVYKYLSEVIEYVDTDIEINDTIDFGKLLKAYDCKVEERHRELGELLIDYMSLLNKYCDIRVFVLINLKNYLSRDKLKEFLVNIQYLKIDVLIIEANTSSDLCQNETVFVLDDDLCEI